MNSFIYIFFIATLDKEKLIELINDLVDSNPHLKAEFEAQIEQQ